MKFPSWSHQERGGLSATGLSLVLMLGIIPREAEANGFSSAQLKRMSMEELMDIEVSSVSKQKESLLKTGRGMDPNQGAKVLILIDGRTILTPTPGGVYLEVR